ncbi:MAG: CDP-alcohol phosphatidyltransferase family protein [Desulfovermiculus sp.]
MGLRESKIGRIYLSFMDKKMLGWLKKKGLGPNTVTLAGLAIACLVPAGFALSPWAGFALIAVSGIADSLDGMLARATQQQSVFGSFWDSTLDRVADCAYLLGFLILFWQFPGWWLLMAVIIFFLALLGTLLISYTKAKIESLGQACHSGFMSRPVRIIFLLAWALLLALVPGAYLEMLWLGLGLYLVLTLFTVGQRIFEARRVLAG